LEKETGISQTTLSKWLREQRSETTVKDDEPVAKRPQDWSAEEKLRAVAQASQLSESDLGEYLRRYGLHAATVEQWKKDAVAGLSQAGGPRSGTTIRDAKRIKELERELRKKESALAETAALLVLRKKVNALWGDGEDDTDEKNES
jgi:transposase-like protein